MKFHGVGVQNIGSFLPLRAAGSLSRGRGLGQRLTACSTLAGGIVNGDARLDVVSVCTESDPFPAVLYTVSLHQYAGGHQVISFKNRSDPVEYMVASLLYIVGNHIFKGQHSIHIHVSGAGDQILFVGIFPGQLESDQMAAIVKVLPIHPIVLHCLPAGRFYLPDAAPFLSGHQVGPDTGISDAAAAQIIQVTVGFKGGCGIVILCKVWNIVIDRHIRAAVIGRQIGHGIDLGGVLGPLTAGQQTAQQT